MVYSDCLLFSTELLEITLGATQLLTEAEELCEINAILVIFTPRKPTIFCHYCTIFIPRQH